MSAAQQEAPAIPRHSDREANFAISCATFDRVLPDLMREHAGEHVWIDGEEVKLIRPTLAEVLDEAERQRQGIASGIITPIAPRTNREYSIG